MWCQRGRGAILEVYEERRAPLGTSVPFQPPRTILKVAGRAQPIAPLVYLSRARLRTNKRGADTRPAVVVKGRSGTPLRSVSSLFAALCPLTTP
jgi:hypothetical protein